MKETSNGLCFQELIHKIHEKQGKVVILIDEYDKAIVDYLDDKPKAYAHRDALKSFYEVLKNNQEYIHFVFLTGVTKFSKVSLFSALNHLSDISFSPDYNDLVGYTQQELEFYFKDYIVQSASKLKMSEKTLLRDIKKWYNGYNWTGKNTLYNPFSILGFFQDSFIQKLLVFNGNADFFDCYGKRTVFLRFG